MADKLREALQAIPHAVWSIYLTPVQQDAIRAVLAESSPAEQKEVSMRGNAPSSIYPHKQQPGDASGEPTREVLEELATPTQQVREGGTVGNCMSLTTPLSPRNRSSTHGHAPMRLQLLAGIGTMANMQSSQTSIQRVTMHKTSAMIYRRMSRNIRLCRCTAPQAAL